MSDSHLYSRLLLRKGHGYPLFHPQPSDDLPFESRLRGIEIGDVGVVTSDGSFDVIFNICRSADDPVNRFGVPEEFEQVHLGPLDVVSQPQYHPSGSVISNTRIHKRRLDVDAGVESNVFLPLGAGAVVEISTSSKETAVLLLPDGASRTGLRYAKIFRDYALKHAPRWYEFVNGTMGRMVENGDLFLVTGTDKSSSWSVAALENHSGDGVISLKLKAAQVGSAGKACAWEWESASSSVDSGPRPLPADDEKTENQTVFLRGFKVTISSSRLRKSAKAISIVDILSNYGGSPFSHPRLTNTLASTINQYPVNSSPAADVVVTHDDEPRNVQPRQNPVQQDSNDPHISTEDTLSRKDGNTPETATAQDAEITEPMLEKDVHVDAVGGRYSLHFLEVIRWAINHNSTAEVQTVLEELSWIFEKFDSASVTLPPPVVDYTESLMKWTHSFRGVAALIRLSRHIKSQRQHTPLASLDKEEQWSLHLSSAFLINSTTDVQSDSHGSFQKGLRINDFNGRQVYVPLELCQSWTDLSSFLEILLRGDDESYFISSGNFGIRVPNELDLLSRDTWHIWLNRCREDSGNVLATLTLYAIMRDDSDSCPRCNTSSPVKHPLPDNLQRCANCQFTFLEVYRDVEVGLSTVSTTPDTAGKPLPPIPDSSEESDGNHVLNAAESSLVSNSTSEQLDSASAPLNPDGQMSSAVQFSGESVPRNVQMIRRRKPVVHDSEDPHITPEAILSPTTSVTVAHPPQTPSNYLKHFHVLLGFVLFRLPDRYFRDVPTLPRDADGFALYKRWINEWTQMGTVAGILFGLLFTVLQISSAAYDPIARTVVQLAMVCLFFGAIYAFILSATFGKLETEPEGLGWIWQMADRLPNNTLWNTWIMLSLPLAWIIWGVIYFALFMLVFFWRSGASNEPDDNSKPSPKQEYGPRAITTLMMIVGTVYLALMIMAVKRMGSRNNTYIELQNVASGPS